MKTITTVPFGSRLTSVKTRASPLLYQRKQIAGLFLSEQNYPRSPCLKEKAKIPRIKILLGQGVMFSG